MATDSSGWNTSSAFQQATYDPTALASGLQSAATYDPTNQSTSTPASLARYLGNTQGNAAAAADTNPSTSTASLPTATTTGLTDASNNALNAGYKSKLAVSQGTAASTAGINANQAGAQAAATTAAQAQNAYAGPQIVAVPGPNGLTSYYKWNPATATYDFVQVYSKDGAVYGGYAKGGLFGDKTPYGGNATISEAERTGATVVNNLAQSNDPTSYGSQVTQAQQGAINTWNAANANSTANASAAAAAAAGTAMQQQALDYMTTHNGQLDPNMAALLNNTWSGDASVQQAQQAAIQKAQQQYAAQTAHAQALADIGIKPIDTKASDAVDTAALNSLISQYAGQGGQGGQGSYYAAALGGQHVLNNEKASATSYNSNLTNFANALNSQNSTDKEATGNQLYADVQSVQQIASQLQQEVGQLSTAHQAQAQQQINNLTSLLNAYQQAVAAFGQNSTQAMQAATGILSAAGSVAAAVV